MLFFVSNHNKRAKDEKDYVFSIFTYFNKSKLFPGLQLTS